MKNILKYSTLLFVTALLLIGCSNNKKSTDEKHYVTIKGSDTMLHLTSSWAESLMNNSPNIDISVTGGGSGTGISALLNGTTDICMASRGIKSKEIDQANSLGITPKEFVVARDGIAVVVNPANPISELSIEQIGKIYTGSYTNWSQVGGPNEDIIVLSRESSSGTYVFFQERVMDKNDYTADALLMPSTSAIIQSINQDEWSIGYVGLGYALSASNSIKILSVFEKEGQEAVAPSIETVIAGDYVIARPLHFYTNGEPKGIVKEILNFCMSSVGQKIVLETGYVPVN